MSTEIDNVSREIRRSMLDMINCARRGHIGSAFSIVEILRVLYEDILKYDARNPLWPERDRFILSKGHGCLALYPILSKAGFFPEQELGKLCKKDGILGGHPEYGKVPGVEASTGALGHGLPIGVGMALAGKIDKKKYRVFVLLGDGECNEGSIWEAAMVAAKHKIDNLTAIIDYNKLQCYGPTDVVLDMAPFSEKWKSFGWSVRETDGHNTTSLRTVLKDVPFSPGKPGVLICNTVRGKGLPFIENSCAWHHKSKISDEEMKNLCEGLEKR